MAEKFPGEYGAGPLEDPEGTEAISFTDEDVERVAEALGGALIDAGLVPKWLGAAPGGYRIENVKVWNQQVDAVTRVALSAYLEGKT